MPALLKRYHNREDGFTLIELLIVVLIIGILAAIAIPVYMGIQNQAKHSAVKADTNQRVKQVQVALTENAVSIPTTASSTGITGYSDSSARSDGATVVTTPLGSGQFQVQGTGADGYTYTYSSLTGQFTEGSASVALGGSGSGNVAPTFTSSALAATASVNTSYSATVAATGTPTAMTYTVSTGSLPAGLNLNASTGVISGTPTTIGSSTFTITASNGTSPDATQSETINVVALQYVLTMEANDPNASMWTFPVYNGAVAAYSTAQAHGGSQSIYIGANTYTRLMFSTPLPANKTYTVTYWVYAVSGQGNGMNFSSGTTYYGYGTTIGQWKQVTATYTPTGSTTYLSFGSYGAGASYIDDLTVTQTN